MPRKQSIPTYRLRRDRGGAVVTLTDSVTKSRREIWLGEYGTAESQQRYERVIAEWLTCGRRLPAAKTSMIGGPTVDELIYEYWPTMERAYSPSYLSTLRAAIRLLRSMYGASTADSFGPLDLRLLRDAMIRGDSRTDPPRAPWSRAYTNQHLAGR